EHRLVPRAEGPTVEALALEVSGEDVTAALRDPRPRAGALDEIERVEPRLGRVGNQAPEEVVGADQDAAHDPPQSMTPRRSRRACILGRWGAMERDARGLSGFGF